MLAQLLQLGCPSGSSGGFVLLGLLDFPFLIFDGFLALLGFVFFVAIVLNVDLVFVVGLVFLVLGFGFIIRLDFFVFDVIFGRRILDLFLDVRGTPELDDPKTLEWIGRFLGRIHACAATRPFRSRPDLDVEAFGEEPRAWLLGSGLIPADVLPAWKSAAVSSRKRKERKPRSE